MSWEAVAWANNQKLRLPQEQLVLLVLANCADPQGLAFAKWRGSRHWWHYVMEKTRLSRSSVFRHLKTIEHLGLIARSDLVLDDGSRRPIVECDLTKTVDLQALDQSTDESHGENEFICNHSHGETDESHGETGVSLTVRLAESHGETQPIYTNLDSNLTTANAVVSARARQRGMRLPDDGQPTLNELAFARTLLPENAVAVETEKFRDYWHARAGPGAVKRDWAATWRNWCRKAAESKSSGASHGRSSRDPRRSVTAAIDRQLRRAYERERGDGG